MATIVIHIGLPKTGSASIQSFLSLNEKPLRELSVDYPIIGRVRRKDHHNFASELQGRKNFEEQIGTLRELRQHWESDPSRTKIISTEKFESLDVGQILELRKSLRLPRHNFLIVMVIRNPIDLLPSSYIQKVRYGLKTYDFDFFFKNRISESRTDYFHTANKWASAFGWDHLCVRVLDPAHLINGDLIDDFLATVGLAPDEPRVRALARVERVNESSGWRIVESLRALYGDRHRLSADHPLVAYAKRNQRMYDKKIIETTAIKTAREMGWNNEKGDYFTREQADICMNMFNESVSLINQNLRETVAAPPSLDSRGFRERRFLPDASEIPSQDLREFYDHVGASLDDQRKSLKGSNRAWRAG